MYLTSHVLKLIGKIKFPNTSKASFHYTYFVHILLDYILDLL